MTEPSEDKDGCSVLPILAAIILLAAGLAIDARLDELEKQVAALEQTAASTKAAEALR